MSGEGPVPTGRLLLFRVGPGRFAVLLDDVLGVQDPAEIGAETDRGVMFRGRPVAAVDARGLWWGCGQPGTMTPPAAIIVSSGAGSTALVVDQVEGIAEGVEMRPLPALVATFARGVFRGFALHADGGRLVVDPAGLSGTATEGGQGRPGE